MKNAWKPFGWGGLLIVVLTVAAYQPALRGGFIWDDDSYVTQNPTLRSLEGLRKIWTQPGLELQQYYPLSFTGFWVQYHLWDLRPFAYHLVNILLHALNAVLLWCLLRRLELPGSWWAAALFALHPVQVESAAWITEFKNVSSATFSLLSLLAFLRFRPLSAGAHATQDWHFYVLSILMFLCALLCKTAVCCLPVVVVVLMWWKLDRLEKRDVLALVPWFVTSLTLGLITVGVETHSRETSTIRGILSIVHGGLLAGRALWFYAGKLVWPHPLTFIYPRWKIDMAAPWQYLFPLAALGVLIALWLLRRRIGKGPLAGVLCFAVLLSPVLGFFDIYFFRYSYVTDHFQYLACIGLLCLAASATATVAHRAGQRGGHLGALVGAIVLLLLGESTWRQAHAYKDLETLWRDTLAKNPTAWIAHNNLGAVLQSTGRVTEAIGHYEQAVQIHPDFAEAHCNLGTLLGQAGRVEEAIQHLNQAVQIKPSYAEAHYNLAKALMVLGRTQEAAVHYGEVLRLNPNDVEAQYDLGNALLALGRVQEATVHWEQVVRIKPDYVEARNNLGAALAQIGRLPEAIEQFDLVLRITPGDAEAHYNLAVVLEQSGKIADAIKHYEQALQLKPDYPDAQNRLARLRPAH